MTMTTMRFNKSLILPKINRSVMQSQSMTIQKYAQMSAGTQATINSKNSHKKAKKYPKGCIEHAAP
jgi:hypothetical protein